MGTRDCRITDIYEGTGGTGGTGEIQRLIIAGILLDHTRADFKWESTDTLAPLFAPRRPRTGQRNIESGCSHSAHRLAAGGEGGCELHSS